MTTWNGYPFDDPALIAQDRRDTLSRQHDRHAGVIEAEVCMWRPPGGPSGVPNTPPRFLPVSECELAALAAERRMFVEIYGSEEGRV